MEKKINVAELLKDCPKGMELDCILYNGVATLDKVTNNIYYPISINVSYNNENICVILTEYGQTAPTMFNKCVIFPKGKTTWEGFVPPCKFKAGDVLVSRAGNIVLFSHIDSYNCVKYHCIIPTYGSFRIEEKTSTGVGRYYDCVLANEQQRQKMYNQIKCSGYKYNQEINKLEKLNEPEPKFKIGDRIKHKTNTRWVCTIARVADSYYLVDGHPTCFTIKFSEHDEYELVPNKFDINTLKPFDKVLVRCGGAAYWEPQFFSKYEPNVKLPFKCTYNNWAECIPYEANKHLCGTTNDCDDFYKTWE